LPVAKARPAEELRAAYGSRSTEDLVLDDAWDFLQPPATSTLGVRPVLGLYAAPPT